LSSIRIDIGFKNVTFFTEVMIENDIGYLTLNPAVAAFACSSSIYVFPDRID